jgi:hypothetical protein
VKIIAYCLSLVIAGICLFFICAQGITFGNEKVEKWLTSFLTSVLSSVFLTQPIQVALTTFFFVSIFRKNTEFNKDTIQKKKIDQSDNVNEQITQNLNVKYFRNEDTLLPQSSGDMKEIRLERLKERKLKEVLKKAIMHSIFLMVLYATAFSNRNLNCFKYQSVLNNQITKANTQSFSIDLVNYFFFLAYLRPVLFHFIFSFQRFKE